MRGVNVLSNNNMMSLPSNIAKKSPSFLAWWSFCHDAVQKAKNPTTHEQDTRSKVRIVKKQKVTRIVRITELSRSRSLRT
jgi:hypothetical protein